MQREDPSCGRPSLEVCVYKGSIPLYHANVTVDILLPWHNSVIEFELGTRYVDNVLLAVSHCDLEDFVLVHAWDCLPFERERTYPILQTDGHLDYLNV